MIEELSLTFLNFGSVKVGETSAAQTVTLTNASTIPFSIGGIKVTGSEALAFRATDNCPASLAGGASCSASVTFEPKAAKGFQGDASIRR